MLFKVLNACKALEIIKKKWSRTGLTHNFIFVFRRYVGSSDAGWLATDRKLKSTFCIPKGVYFSQNNWEAYYVNSIDCCILTFRFCMHCIIWYIYTYQVLLFFKKACFSFITARRYASAVLAVIVCLSVRPSVCPSVRHKSELYKDG